MFTSDARRGGWRDPLIRISFLLLVASPATCFAAEPAQEFLNQLRAAGHFEMAIEYLDRLDRYPGVAPEITSARLLEKAQTYIDAGVAARQTKDRDERFRQAEEQLTAFLNAGSHPRQSQARLQLGRLQMVRAAQLQGAAQPPGAEPDETKNAEARESFLAAAKTFDTIVKSLRGKLKEMQGAKIDPKKNPEKASQRDQYRGEFLEGIKNAGEARLSAAQTFANPGREGKKILEKSLETFTELSDKYESYVQGAIALAFRGEVQAELGMKSEAIDSFIRMLEQPDVDELRDAKFRAAAGMIRVQMSQSPPKFQEAIDRCDGILDGIRPNEKSSPIVQTLRLALAKAQLAKAADKENQKPAAVKRAESSGRQLLIEASKFPGSQASEASELLSGMGIKIAETPKDTTTTENPVSFSDALSKARMLLASIQELKSTSEMLQRQAEEDETLQQQQVNIDNQMQQSREDAIRILRAGLGMVTETTEVSSVNQARQLLAYLLYLNKSYRSASVVGRFLAQAATGTDIGLQGGLLALNSLQLLLAEDSESEGLASQLEQLGNYLTDAWPDDPRAAAAQGTMVKLALKSGTYDEAQKLIDRLPDGREKSSLLRLMGRFYWEESIRQRNDDKQDEAALSVSKGEQALRTGLQGMDGESAGVDAMKSALTLAKIYLEQNKMVEAAATLDHQTYGPKGLVEKLGAPDKSFASDLYSTELRIVVQLMTAPDGDSKELLDRAAKVMKNLRDSAQGPDAQKRLTGIYVRMAREIRDQLDRADPGRRAKLIDAFRLFLQHIASTTTEPATLNWTATTLIELAESSMGSNKVKADGQAAPLLKIAIATLEQLKKNGKEPSLVVDFQLGRAQRMSGDYDGAIDTLEGVLKQKPMMLDAQMEAAQAYEQWAAVVLPKYADRAYQSALNGARPNEKNEKTIWGWGKISQLTSRDPKHRATFFEARYHVALCRFLWGKATNRQAIIEKSATDITRVHSLYPQLGDKQQHDKFNQLLKTIQKELGQKQVGLPPSK